MAKSSSQKFIARNRAPRVNLTYDVQVYGAQQQISLPFVVGVFADLSGQPAEELPPVAERRFRNYDVDNFDDQMNLIQPRVVFDVPDLLTDDGELRVDITFASMDDFGPARVASQVPELQTLLDARTQFSNLLTYMDSKGGAETTLDAMVKNTALLQSLASATNEAPNPIGVEAVDVQRFSKMLNKELGPKSERASATILATTRILATYILTMPHIVRDGVVRTIEALIQLLDGKLSDQINVIIHHPGFQDLEGSWRGLHFLVNGTETGETLKIRVLNISKRELGRTLKKYRGSAWDQSPIMKKLYDEEFGQMGGEPYGCLVGDFYFDHSPMDGQILGELARIAATAHAPFISGASPSYIGADAWQDISMPRDLSKVFSTAEYALWRTLRESDDSRYIGLAMPRFLARLPYGDDTEPVEEFEMREQTGRGKPENYTWCNSAYGVAVNITRAFQQYGWCSRIRGVESGGMLEGLPVHVFPSDDGSVEMRSPTEVSISDRWEAELSRNGLMPLVHKKGTDQATFISAQSIHKPPEYDDPDITANAALTARFPYLLACCRFAHYIKCIVRDSIGSYPLRADLEARLNEWISQFIDPDPAQSSEETKARRPLADAQIVVDEVEDDAFSYTAKLYVRPHYQLEGLTVSNRLIIRLEHAA